tara:strand:+ start:865 stop:1635 length:771 start_codon:yes stop_codon:yes gene_type:complete
MSHERYNVKKQHTLSNLTEELLENTILVVQDSQKELYEDIAFEFNVELMVLPKHITTLSPSIEFVGYHTVEDKFFILDDDLKFAYREDINSTKLTPCNDDEFILGEMFELLILKLDTYPMVGVSARFGNNNFENSYKECTRQMCFHGFRKKEFLMVEHSRVLCRQDFDRTLQYLIRGWKNYVTYLYTHDQPGSNTEGGCSTYRDHKMLKEQAYKLQELHPDFVTVVKKKTKTSWKGEERYDVRVQWKKAFESSEDL